MRPLFPLIALLVALAGCGQTPAPDASGKEGEKAGKPVGPGAGPKAGDAAKKFAADFLKAVAERKAKPEQLTADFKKAFAPPVFDADRPQGYSDAVAATELGVLATEVSADDVTAVSGADGSAYAVGKGKLPRTLLRLVTAGGEWKVDWISIGRVGTGDAALSGDDAGGQFAAQAFADALLRNKFSHAAALLTADAKTRLGTSKRDGKFDAGTLQNTLRELLAGADKYAVAKTTRDGPAVVLTLDVPTAGGTKAATVKTVKGTRLGEWLVDGAEVK